jgi:hypothetical protein
MSSISSLNFDVGYRWHIAILIMDQQDMVSILSCDAKAEVVG